MIFGLIFLSCYIFCVLLLQGNSNSLATIDLAAGYKGLEDYSLPLVGLLTLINTYAGPIYWFLCLMEVLPSVCSSPTLQTG